MQDLLRELHFERMRNQQPVIKELEIREHKLLYKEKPGAALGSILWESAVSLCHFIDRNRSLFENKRVIELGSGLGLPSILVSRVAEYCVATDKPEMIPLLTENININQTGRIEARELEWGNSIGKFDIILGADIVYYNNSFTSLYHSIQASSTPSTLIFLSYKPRHSSEEIFFKTMDSSFSCISTSAINESTIICYKEKSNIN
jgi:predicted nicotinamide N-methyase